MSKKWNSGIAAITVIALTCLGACSDDSSTPNGPSTATNPVSEDYKGLHFPRKSNNRRIIIFVHGFTGDGKSTWQHDRTQAYWPDLVINDGAFSDSDVAVYTYETSLFERSFSIDEVADNLRLRLDAAKIPKNYEEVVFLAHSMGGLVVRAFALKHRDLVKIPAAFFFATPTNGSDLANIGSLLVNDKQIQGLKDLAENLYLQSLSSQWLASPLNANMRSYCAYETKKTSGVFVVPRDSATALCNQRLDPIGENHIRIVKPANNQDDAYVAFKVAYEETFERLQLIKDKPDITISSNSPELQQGRKVLVGNRIQIAAGSDVVAPDGFIIVANDLVFGEGATLRGRNLSIVATTVSGGTIDVSGQAGQDGSELLVAAGQIRGTRIVAVGGHGPNGNKGKDGTDGAAGAGGRDGDCAGFGGWRSAQAGQPGGPGTDGVDGGDGGDGGNGGIVYLLALNETGIQPDVSGGDGGAAGQGGRGGRGGPGGRGGAGCTGLGGSQASRPSGADGRDGLDGRNGSPGSPGQKGSVWEKQIASLSAIAKHMPSADEVPDYADDIVRTLKAAAQGR